MVFWKKTKVAVDDAGGASSGTDEVSPPTQEVPSATHDKAVRKRKRSRVVNNFTQQKLHGWRPVPSAAFAIIFLESVGVIVFGLGIYFYFISKRILWCHKDYLEDLGSITKLKITPADCVADFKEITGDVYFYYGLTNFYQNHRLYMKSLNNDQLRGEIILDKDKLSMCSPRAVNHTSGLILHPCGNIAASVFNDSFVLYDTDYETDPNSKIINIDERRQTICWRSDFTYRFKNPSHEAQENAKGKVDFWLNTTDKRRLFNADLPGRLRKNHYEY